MEQSFCSIEEKFISEENRKYNFSEVQIMRSMLNKLRGDDGNLTSYNKNIKEINDYTTKIKTLQQQLIRITNTITKQQIKEDIIYLYSLLISRENYNKDVELQKEKDKKNILILENKIQIAEEEVWNTLRNDVRFECCYAFCNETYK